MPRTPATETAVGEGGQDRHRAGQECAEEDHDERAHRNAFGVGTRP
ncbi:hypothetical protein [Streptomyces sp. NPDC012510]